MFTTPGTPRIKVLDTDGITVLKTLYLPPPNQGDGVSLEWIPKEFKHDLIDGSERTRRLGYIPLLTLKWKVYDDSPGQGFTIGSANGNMPSADDLMAILSTTPGLIKVSPGPSAGGFIVDNWKVGGFGLAGASFANGLSIAFRGRSIQAAMTLGAF